jgi:Leucine-rich repeat (LRR) protein
LLYLHCSGNQLTSFSDNLPKSLQELDCSYNQLTSLPDNLPKSLQTLFCSNNQLTSLYPNLMSLQSTKEEINYIREVNTERGIQKCKEWLAKVNQHNIFLELYERRMMNPIYF